MKCGYQKSCSTDRQCIPLPYQFINHLFLSKIVMKSFKIILKRKERIQCENCLIISTGTVLPVLHNIELLKKTLQLSNEN